MSGNRSFLVCVLIASLVLVGLPSASAAQGQAASSAPAAASSADDALNKGKALLRRGRAAEALVQLETALKLYTEAKRRRGEATAHDLLGELYERQGRPDLALEHFKKAHEIFAAAASEVSAGSVLASAVLTNFDAYRANLMLSKIGQMHLRQGQLAEASATFSRMNATKPDTSTLGSAKKAQGTFGRLSSISSASSAKSAVLEAGSLVKQQIEAYHQTIIYSAHEMGMGRVDYRQGQLDSAKKHFENALLAAKGDIPGIGQLGQTQRYRTAARTSLGDIALKQGRYADAVKLFNDAVKGARDDKRLDLAWPAQRGLGRAQWMLSTQEKDAKKAAKARETALVSYREAIKSIEALRQGSIRADEARTTFLATTEDVFDEASSLLAEMALAALTPAPAAGQPGGGALQGQSLAYASEALGIVEQGRARSLLDMLGETRAEITEGVPVELLKRRQENRERQEELADQLTGATVAGEPSDKPLGDIEKELKQLQDDFDKIENEIRVASPRYASLTAAAPLSLQQVQQQVLDEQTILLEYSLGEDSSYLWAVTKTGASLFRLPNRSTIEKQVADVRDQILPASLRRQIVTELSATRGIGLSSTPPPASSAPPFAGVSHTLYQTVVGPAAPLLGDKRLLIAADGALNYVPFEALVTVPSGTSYATLAYLIKTNEVVYAPSSSAVAAIRQQAQGAQPSTTAMLIVADPIFDPNDERLRAPKPAATKAATTAPANKPAASTPANNKPAANTPATRSAAPGQRAGAPNRAPANRGRAPANNRAAGTNKPAQANPSTPAQQPAQTQAAQTEQNKPATQTPAQATAQTAAQAPAQTPAQQTPTQTGAGNKLRGLSLSGAVADVAKTGQQQQGAAPPAGVLVRLEGTRDEANMIEQQGKATGFKADKWLDLDARESNFDGRDLRSYRVIHVATHGLLNAERPQLTGIVLSQVGDDAHDGFLRTDEVFNLRLGRPLVMLSACETGLGRERRGEGVIGLTRAFMYAGASSVGVSLWSVSDRSTAELMADFYKRLLAGQNTSPPAALRAAQQAMIAGEKYSAPFYWAPFVIVGDWRF